VIKIPLASSLTEQNVSSIVSSFDLDGQQNERESTTSFNSTSNASFTITAEHFQDIQLTDYEGKYLVLFFYPLDFTFVCPTQLIAFNERLNEFRQLDVQVIGCSTDSVYSHSGYLNWGDVLTDIVLLFFSII
jgi:alkyl hydroperoxide reductase subunit AhpC